MKTKMVGVTKGVVFCLLAAIMLCGMNRVLTIKGHEYDVYNSYAQHVGFYDMDRDSVDVLLLGPSHCYCGFIPQELYNRYGIRSYNLGTSRQSMWISYYWLREALKTQSPQIIVLETSYFDRENGDEASIQKALSYMKWSDNKIEAVRTALTQFPELSFKSFLMPNIRFHDRWKELDREDFMLSDLWGSYKLKGYAASSKCSMNQDYTPLRIGREAGAEREEASEPAEWPDISREYMDRITELCKERGITLVLFKTPTTAWPPEKHNAVADYAAEKGLPFHDLNEAPHYEAMQYDFAADNMDDGHANVWGAKKITGLLGELLTQKYGARRVKDEQYEETAAFVQKIEDDYEITRISEADKYLSAIDREELTVFISVKGSAPELGAGLGKAWDKTGFSRIQGGGYAAVLSGQGASRIEEDTGKKEAAVSGTCAGGQVPYEVVSTAGKKGQSSIKIDGKEYSPGKEGINIVVYSSLTHRVLDAVCLTTESGAGLER